MSETREIINQLARQAMAQISGANNIDEAWVAPIEPRPRYHLRDVHFLPHALLNVIERYAPVDEFGLPYVRTYLSPIHGFVPSLVVGAPETIIRLANRDGVGHNVREVRGSEKWYKQLQGFVCLSNLHAKTAPHFYFRRCSFVIQQIGFMIANELEARSVPLKIKKYAHQLGKQSEFFAHLTPIIEEEELPIIGHGLVVTNSREYAQRNPHFNWQPLDQEL